MIALIIFITSLAIQLFYFLAIFSKLIWFKSKKTETVQPRVSVIVAARNEYQNLKQLVPILLSQQYTDFEIIIALDRCSDSSSEFVKEIAQTDARLKFIVISEKQGEFDPKKYAITQAVAMASGPMILLTDADCRPDSPLWIEEILAVCEEDTDLVLGYSPYFAQKGLLNKLIRYETFYTAVQYFSLTLVGHPYMAVGRNFGYTKNYFEKVKGYTGIENLTGGDDDLLVQKGKGQIKAKICFSEKAQVFSVPHSTWTGWFQQKQRHLSAGKYYSSISRLILGFLTLSHLLFYISFFMLAAEYEFPLTALAGFIVRLTVFIVIFGLISEKFKEKFATISLPLLDFLYILNYLVVGIKAVVSRKVTWK